MSETLAWIVLGSVVLYELLSVGYISAGGSWSRRPVPFVLISAVYEISAVWLALRVVL